MLVNMLKRIKRNINKNIFQTKLLFDKLLINSNYDPFFQANMEMALRKWISNCKKNRGNGRGRILIAGLVSSFWDYWAVYSACYIYQMGYSPVLLYSKKSMGENGNEDGGFWKIVENGLPFQSICFESVTLENDETKSKYIEFASEFAEFNTIYFFQKEDLGEAPQEKQYYNRLNNIFPTWGAISETILKKNQIERIVSASGVLLKTFALFKAAKRIEIPMITVEGWGSVPAQNTWNTENPAVIDFDFKGWADQIKWTSFHEKWFEEYIRFQENPYKKGRLIKNQYPFQRKSISEKGNENLDDFLKRKGSKILLATNVSADSATIKRGRLWDNQKSWLFDVITFFKGRDDLNLIIRAHPSEKWMRPQERMGDYAKKCATDKQNIFIIDGEDDTNTFSILPEIDLALVWLSTIGIDITLRQIPVLLAAKAPYSGSGICLEPETQIDYFSKISELINQHTKFSSKKLILAKKYLYILNRAMWLEINKNGYDYKSWRISASEVESGTQRRKLYRILTGELDKFGNKLNESH